MPILQARQGPEKNMNEAAHPNKGLRPHINVVLFDINLAVCRKDEIL
jgi:hypothetical protein